MKVQPVRSSFAIFLIGSPSPPRISFPVPTPPASLAEFQDIIASWIEKHNLSIPAGCALGFFENKTFVQLNEANWLRVFCDESTGDKLYYSYPMWYCPGRHENLYVYRHAILQAARTAEL
eukprot:TRINITY_DN7341_c0_g1_i1.p1 TRINITY_DN7341_c0_g1~~TRINITY_DN7341_c0_g1_i1.p1  ORF type:complete len:120 (-),score=19.71 TRINITY_DN7341_c0_g1_i1:30-389(-)